MSVENINTFCLKSIKSELERKQRLPKRNNSKYSNWNCKKLIKKYNPKLKLPPIEKASSVGIKENVKQVNDKFHEIKNEITDLKKLFDDTNVDLESNDEPQSQVSLIEESEIHAIVSAPFNDETESLPFTEENVTFTEENVTFTEENVTLRSEFNDETESLPFIEENAPLRSECSDETSILSIVENIIELEDKLKESFIELEKENKERLKNENEICLEIQSIDKSSKCPFEKRNSQKFLKICKYKNTKQSITKPKFIANTVKIKSDHHKTQEKFKSKNTQQLSKNTNMSTLTDEEKARINELLADMDENGEDIKLSEVINDEPISSNKENISKKAFVYTAKDKSKIEDIEHKLLGFEETKEKRENPASSIDVSKSVEEIDWKDINRLTIKEIDQALKKIHLTDRSCEIFTNYKEAEEEIEKDDEEKEKEDNQKEAKGDNEEKGDTEENEKLSLELTI